MVKFYFAILMVVGIMLHSTIASSQVDATIEKDYNIQKTILSDSLIDKAEKLLTQRQFSEVIALLSAEVKHIRKPATEKEAKALHIQALAHLNTQNPKGYDYMQAVLDYSVNNNVPNQTALYFTDYAEALVFTKTLFAYELVTQALELLGDTSANLNTVIRANQVLGKNLMAQGKSTEAIKPLSQALAAHKQDTTHQPMLRQQLLTNLAVAYNMTGQGDSALKYSSNAHQILHATSNNKGLQMAQVLGNLSRALMLTGSADSAIATRKRALKMHLELTGNKSQFAGGSYYHLAIAQYAAGQTKKALENIQKSILTNYPEVPDTLSFEKMPEKLQANTNVNAVLQGLMQKTYFFEQLYEKHHEKKWIALARSHFLVVDTLVNQLQQSVPFRHLPTVIKLNNAGYDHALKIFKDFQKEYPEKDILHDVYHFAVATKAKMLAYQIQSMKSTTEAEVSELKKQRSVLESRLTTLKSAIHTKEISPERDSVRMEYLLTQIKLLSVIDEISLVEAAENTQDLSANPVALKDIQSHLEEDEALVEYVETGHGLYIFCTTTKETKVKIVEAGETFNRAYRQFLRAIKTGSPIPGTNELNKYLLSPVYNLIQDKEYVTFIPDEKLFNIPFEALKIPGKAELLVTKHAIAYNYSAKLWLESRNTELSDFDNELVAFAPGFNTRDNATLASAEIYRTIDDSLAKHIFRSSDRSSLAPLPYSIDEVNIISDIFEKAGKNTRIFKGSAATEPQFRSLPTSRILHIATHGYSSMASPEESGLFFTTHNNTETTDHKRDGFVHINELFGMNFNSDLVILSACKSGTGKILEGEGVYALPRGFIYAGVPNLMASLWKVHDQKTMELITCFYENLAEGKSYREALKQAKIKMINAGELPLDWSGIVLIGN